MLQLRLCWHPTISPAGAAVLHSTSLNQQVGVLQVRLCRRILRALASNSQPQQQEREAVTLLKASLDPSTLLATSSLHEFEACLDTVLFHSHRLLPATVTTLLGCFSLPVYASKLLEGDPKKAVGAGEQSSGWAREESARVSEWHFIMMSTPNRVRCRMCSIYVLESFTVQCRNNASEA